MCERCYEYKLTTGKGIYFIVNPHMKCLSRGERERERERERETLFTVPSSYMLSSSV